MLASSGYGLLRSSQRDLHIQELIKKPFGSTETQREGTTQQNQLEQLAGGHNACPPHPQATGHRFCLRRMGIATVAVAA
jgi:hypothetical protein